MATSPSFPAARSSAASCAITRACCASIRTPCWPRCPTPPRRPRTSNRRWRRRRAQWASCPRTRTPAPVPRAGPFRWRWSPSLPWRPSTKWRARPRNRPSPRSPTSRRLRRSRSHPPANPRLPAHAGQPQRRCCPIRWARPTTTRRARRPTMQPPGTDCRRWRRSSPATPADAANAPIVLTFQGTSWAEVRDATGTPVLSVTGNAGDVHAVGGRPPFDVVLGSAAAVSVTWLGKAFDTAPFTKQNVAKFTLQVGAMHRTHITRRDFAPGRHRRRPRRRRRADRHPVDDQHGHRQRGGDGRAGQGARRRRFGTGADHRQFGGSGGRGSRHPRAARRAWAAPFRWSATSISTGTSC